MIKGQSVNPISPKDLKQIFSYLKKKDMIVILGITKICSNTGLRISDILTLTFEDLDFKNFSLKEKKTKKRKTVIFNNSCLEAIKLLENFYKRKKIEKYNTGYLFKSIRNPEKHISYQGVNFYMKKIKKELKIDYPFNTHSFRKTWARAIYFKYNKDLALVMKALNHTNPSVTLRYIGIDEDNLRQIYSDISF